MDMLQKVLAALAGLKYSELDKLSKATGVPHGTLARLKYGQVKNPRFETVERLGRHFNPTEYDCLREATTSQESIP